MQERIASEFNEEHKQKLIKHLKDLRSLCNDCLDYGAMSVAKISLMQRYLNKIKVEFGKSIAS
ncbi:MAG: hypothetical protein BAJALOKI1v1_2530003 [Promethearchaeota archaeon]|nr:MAG: hypothetical protein BAJALOKI1v1_2530003 [Candidatus Lokiarchaeota archaeon]